MTEEQKAWYEYAIAKDNWVCAKSLWSRSTHAENNRCIIHALKNIPGGTTATSWKSYIAAHKKAMAWIPTRRRSCANCALCCRDADSPRGWYCEELDESASDKFDPDELSCLLWQPKKGGEQ